MKRLLASLVVLLALALPDRASGQVLSKQIPIVTQVQGVVFYRTSVTIVNEDDLASATIALSLAYRSPVDGSFQTVVMSLGSPLGPHHVVFFDDVIQAFKDAGVIRAQDLAVGIFGTLSMEFSGVSSLFPVSLLARTYSPATGGGTNGIAYGGRPLLGAGSSTKLYTGVRNGTFGNDGSTRANIGFVNVSGPPTDIQVTYFDGDTGAPLKTFLLSDKAHHQIEGGEVVQINNLFADPSVPSSTTKIIVEASPVAGPVVFLSGYAVQLDNTTNDGSFSFMTEKIPTP